MLTRIYPKLNRDSVILFLFIRKWVADLRSSRYYYEGRSIMTITDENIKKIPNMILEDRPLKVYPNPNTADIPAGYGIF